MPIVPIKIQKQEIKDYANEKALSMLDWFFKEHKIPEKKVKIVITFEPRNGTSYGGLNELKQPGIELAGNLCLNYYPPKVFNEYSHYKEDKIIGSVVTKTWQQYMDLLIAHELSHVFEMLYWVGCVDPKKLKLPENPEFFYDRLYKDHGEFFQEIYKIFRTEFCNKENSI
jgi:hypothetical protein